MEQDVHTHRAELNKNANQTLRPVLFEKQWYNNKNTAFNIYCVEYSLRPSFSFLSFFLDLTISGLVSYVTGKLRVQRHRFSEYHELKRGNDYANKRMFILTWIAFVPTRKAKRDSGNGNPTQIYCRNDHNFEKIYQNVPKFGSLEKLLSTDS